MARDQLGYTELRAEFDGVVTATGAENGQLVNVGQMVVRLADPKALDAVFSIAESVFANSPEGEIPPIAVTLLSNPAVKATGRVREISPVADAVTRTFQIKVALDNPPAEMRFGASVAGRLDRKAEPMVVLPGGALFDKGGEPAVWVVDRDFEVSLKPVTVVRYEIDRVVIGRGLAKGDIVVTAGVNRLHARQKVRLQQGVSE
jgi:RND family efflux transporter MFP subunit